MNKKKIEEIFSDKEFIDSLLQMEEPQQVQEALKAKGLDLSIENIEYLGDLINRASKDELTDTEKKYLESFENEDIELSDEQLESVSGGVIITLFLFHCFTVSALIGVGLMGVGAVGYGAAKTHQATRGRW